MVINKIIMELDLTTSSQHSQTNPSVDYKQKIYQVFNQDRSFLEPENSNILLKSISDGQCGDANQLILILTWMTSTVRKLNGEFIYHPFLIQQYTQDENVLEERMAKIFRGKIRSKQSLEVLWSVSTRFGSMLKQEENYEYEIQNLVLVQKTSRFELCSPQSLQKLGELQSILMNEGKLEKGSLLRRAQQTFLDFMHIEHYSQILIFFKEIFQKWNKNPQVRDSLQKIGEKLNKKREENEGWESYLSRIEFDLTNGYQSNRKSSSSKNSKISSDQSQNAANYILEEIGKQIVRYQMQFEDKISQYKFRYEKIEKNLVSISDMSEHGVEQYLKCLKVVQERQMMDLISESKVCFILKPTCLLRFTDGFSTWMPKGEDRFSKRYCKHDEETPLYSFENRTMLYCFIYSMIKSCQQVESLGIHHGDLKIPNFVKFGYTFKLIDFDHAYWIPRGQAQKEKNIRILIRLMLIYSYTKKQHLETKYMFKGKQDEYGEIIYELGKEIKALQKQSETIPASLLQKVPQILEKYEEKCLLLLRDNWKQSHINQMKYQCLGVLFGSKDPMQNKKLVSSQEIQSIKKAFEQNYFKRKDNHQHFLNMLEKIYIQASPPDSKNFEPLVQCLKNTFNTKYFKSKLTKEQIWDTKKPRYIFAFIKALTKRVSNMLKGKYSVEQVKRLNFDSFMAEGESFVFVDKTQFSVNMKKVKEETKTIRQKYVEVIAELLDFQDHPISIKMKSAKDLLKKIKCQVNKKEEKFKEEEKFSKEEENIMNQLQAAYQEYLYDKRQNSKISYKK